MSAAISPSLDEIASSPSARNDAFDNRLNSIGLLFKLPGLVKSFDRKRAHALSIKNSGGFRKRKRV